MHGSSSPVHGQQLIACDLRWPVGRSGDSRSLALFTQTPQRRSHGVYCRLACTPWRLLLFYIFHPHVLTYLCNVGIPQILAAWTPIQSNRVCTAAPLFPSRLEEQYYMMFYTFRRGNRLFVSLYIPLANGIFVIHIQSHLYVVWSLKYAGSFHPLTFQARRRDVIYI